MSDLKKVYTAVDEESALDALEAFAAAWDSKYPKISKSWYENWPNLSTYFKFPQELRKLIYTTNTIEGFNRQLKKVTKAKSVFPTDDSLFKMLYLAMKDITKKWTGRRQDWSSIYAQLVIYYGDRIPFNEEQFRAECKKWHNGEQTAVTTMKKLNMKKNRFYQLVKRLCL